MVPEGAAGATFTCACGRPIEVPSLSELRTRAGLPTNAVAPEFIIETLLTRKEIPGDGCAECGAGTSDVIHIVADCERATKRRFGGFSWGVLIFSVFFCPPLLIYYWWWLVFYYQKPDEREYGRDKVYTLPLRMCGRCRPSLTDPSNVKRALCRIPEYYLLLEKFPDAKLIVN